MYIGLSLSDPHPDTASDGNKIRTLSATRFAGRYRLVDFMLSNMVNSKINTIGMILNSHFQSLISHIGMGKEWDLARKTGGVTFFPPYLADERQSVNSENDGPLQRAVEYIMGASEEYIVLVDSSIVYNMDYRTAIEAHRKSGADVTAIYTKKRITPNMRENAVIFDITEDGRVFGVNRAPYSSDKLNISLGAYIMRKGYFIQLTSGEKNCGMLRFSRVLLSQALSRLNVLAYEYEGYCALISSVETFYQCNMEMLDIRNRNALFDYEKRRIFTSLRDSLPTKYGINAQVNNAMIADGCQIEGTVINSIICRNVRIKEGAVVKNSILQDDTIIEKTAMLDSVVTDRGVIISEHRSLMGDVSYPVYVDRYRII
ncbi:MAG: glucose-1-phosphate adenylyltransferase subunit GlgD [Oscillospiraceae bacterium]|nr:glucose-1-phosphate adenylyltransferase subunit GlgD [Oscillospiraceae bacterium]